MTADKSHSHKLDSTPLPRIKAFGSWSSHISGEDVAKGARRFGDLKAGREGLYWSEQCAKQGGRGVIRHLDLLELKKLSSCHQVTSEQSRALWHDLLPAPFSARSRVHEYGGGCFCVAERGLYFVNDSDQQIYWLEFGKSPRQITNMSQMRFADLELHPSGRFLVAVGEQHGTSGEHKVGIEEDDRESAHSLPENYLAAVQLSGPELGKVKRITEAHDFYASPRLSPDGERLAWISWDLPFMPWDYARLHVANLSIEEDDKGQVNVQVDDERLIAGGKEDGACFQPLWDEGDGLYYINDGDGYGAPYYLGSDGQLSKCVNTDQNTGIDSLRPLWVFSMASMALNNAGKLLVSGFQDGQCCLQTFSDDQEIQIITQDLASFENLVAIDEVFYGIATTDDQGPHIRSFDRKTGQSYACYGAGEEIIEPGNVSSARLINFTGFQREQVFGLYYAPQNSRFEGEKDQLPPCIITIHGGPTGMADRGYNLKTHYWTTRGFGVFDIDYSGSAGYGRTYRDRLNGQWGTADVADIIAAAGCLTDQQLARSDQIFVSGGSAGGYTALMALVSSDVFAGASCRYPVTDLALLLAITHKFESGYIYQLTGTNEKTGADILAARSPLQRVHEISAPVILFQGLDDKVVPPSQADHLATAIREAGQYIEYYRFDGEGHGFRRLETIVEGLERELAFFSKIIKKNV